LDLDRYIFVMVSSVIECITVANDDHCYSQCRTCINVHTSTNEQGRCPLPV